MEVAAIIVSSVVGAAIVGNYLYHWLTRPKTPKPGIDPKPGTSESVWYDGK